MEQPPGSAARVVAEDTYAWGDAEWLSRRAASDLRRAPMAIYEVHLGSWMRVPEEGDRPLGYREGADSQTTNLDTCHDSLPGCDRLLPVTRLPSGSLGGSGGIRLRQEQ